MNYDIYDTILFNYIAKSKIKSHKWHLMEKLDSFYAQTLVMHFFEEVASNGNLQF